MKVKLEKHGTRGKLFIQFKSILRLKMTITVNYATVEKKFFVIPPTEFPYWNKAIISVHRFG